MDPLVTESKNYHILNFDQIIIRWYAELIIFVIYHMTLYHALSPIITQISSLISCPMVYQPASKTQYSMQAHRAWNNLTTIDFTSSQTSLDVSHLRYLGYHLYEYMAVYYTHVYPMDDLYPSDMAQVAAFMLH